MSAPNVFELQVTDAQLTRYSKLIYETTGIRISPQKKALLSNRLRRRLRETGTSDFDAYFEKLKKLPVADPEWDAFLQEITTHETYLFRDDAHWNWFQNEYLPGVIAEGRAGRRPKALAVWSAACSTGDEAHTAACCIANALQLSAGWSIRIVGTDLGVEAVQHAREGVFGPRAMRLVPTDMKSRYFQQIEAERWKAKPQLSQWMSFQQHNLMLPHHGNFDVVFLKNVLIYFDAGSKTTVLKHIRQALKPGGMLVVSAAEGVTDLVGDFERIHPWLFRWNG